jgi:ADP-heptose:LPS heptosyltransferase
VALTREFGPTALVLRAEGLGDLLTVVPALRALHRGLAGYRRVLATPAALEPLVRLVGGYEVLDTTGLRPLPDLGSVAVAVNLHGRGPQSHRLLLDRHPAELVAFDHPDVAETAGSPRWDPGEHEVTRWCRLLNEHGIPADPTQLDLDLGTGRPRHDDTTVVHPGASAAARRWPVDRFAAVCRHEVDRGRRVVLTGSPSERDLVTRVASAAGLGPGAAACQPDLRGLAAVVAGAGRVVCGDTGVAHLATALHTPSVVIFGPVPPSRWGPPPDRAQHVALWAGTTGDPHAGEPDAGLLAITVPDVLEAIGRLDRVDQPGAHARAGKA